MFVKARAFDNLCTGRAIGAVVAQLLYTETVGGSNPSLPTIFKITKPGAIKRSFGNLDAG